LSTVAGWQEQPLRSLITLIYGLNTLYAALPLLSDRYGFPRPSVALKDLEGLQGLCRAALKTGRSDRLLARLQILERQEAPSYNLLLFQAATRLDPHRPARVIADKATRDYLFHQAKDRPEQIRELAKSAMEGLHPLVADDGQGGDRNRGKLLEREIVRELGFIYWNITGRPPGVTFRDTPTADEAYTGLFVRFTKLVFADLGMAISGRKILERLSSLAIPEWRSDPKRRRRWRAESNPGADAETAQ
jgi:hypothetical protein